MIKKIKYILLLIIFCLTSVSGQGLKFQREIKLDIIADEFYVDELGNFYTITMAKNEITKFSPDGRKLKTAGGFGWSDGLFDKPTSIYATPLEVIVTDYNNNRIQKFDKFLNYVTSFQTTNLDISDLLMENPISIDISTLGDMYILDNKSKRIIKVTGFNNIEKIFGGFSSGDILFFEPTKLKVSSNQRIYVLDRNAIKIFDQFTNALKEIKFENLNLVDFDVDGNIIYLLADNTVYKYSVEKTERILFEIESDIDFLKINKKQNKIYLLTGVSVLEFSE